MPKFTLKVDYPVTLGNPRSHGSMVVEPRTTIEAPGVLVTERQKGSELPPLPDDAYVVDNRGEEKLWPHSLWELVKDEKAAKAPVKEN